MDESLLLSFADLEDDHWWFVVRRRIVLDQIPTELLEEGRNVLEVGCGTGGTMRALCARSRGASISGIEPSEDALAVARQRGCGVRSGTFDSLPTQDSSQDLLLALDVIEHCKDDDGALDEAHRVLTPGGIVLVTVPALPSMWSAHDESNAHFRRYTKQSLQGLFEAHGFERIRITYFNSILLPAAWVARRLLPRVGLQEKSGVARPPRILNATATAVFGLERWMLKHLDLPLGLSLLLVARKR